MSIYEDCLYRNPSYDRGVLHVLTSLYVPHEQVFLFSGRQAVTNVMFHSGSVEFESFYRHSIFLFESTLLFILTSKHTKRSPVHSSRPAPVANCLTQKGIPTVCPSEALNRINSGAKDKTPAVLTQCFDTR